MPETDRLKESKADLRVESLPFSEIPGQSRLFLEYLADPLSLKRFYPSAVASHTNVSARIPEVLADYRTDRDVLCDALANQNREFGAAAKSFESIDLLRGSDTVAVLTGQQAGLFTGPLYTIYKALSAVRMAQCLQGRGFNAVPVFWAATEDHDFEEVSTASVVGRDGTHLSVKYDKRSAIDGRSVGSIELDESIEISIRELFDSLPATEFSDPLRREIGSAYSEGRSFGAAFASLISSLFSKFGLIVVDPLDNRIKQLASPIYVEGVKSADEIVDAIRTRSERLVNEGYHAQVLVEDDYFPLFWHDDEGVRRPLKRSRDGGIAVSGRKKAFSREELIEIASETPERLSPGVMLRPVVQDYLFPAVCYFGGGAEIAYFAQNSEAYRILGRPITPIFHRQSFTVVGAKQARTLAKYDLELADLFKGLENLLPQIIERFIDPQNARLFPDAEEKINTELNRLDQQLSQLDPTLAANLATRRRKIVYHIAALRDKYRRARLRKDEEANRQIRSLFESLLPDGHLQERTLNVSMFLNRYGDYFIDWIYDAIDLDDRGHRIIYL